MAALTATDWTVTVQEQRISHGQRRNRVKLTLATAGSYPSSGVPAPVFGDLGMVRNVDYLIVTDPVAGSVNPVKYDQANHTIRIFVATATAGAHLTELATTVTAGAGGTFILYCESVGW